MEILQSHHYLVQNTTAWVCRGKTQVHHGNPYTSQDGSFTQYLSSLLPSLPLHSGTATLKGIMKRSHLTLGRRKENGLAVGGKTATICYSNQESLLGAGQ